MESTSAGKYLSQIPFSCLAVMNIRNLSIGCGRIFVTGHFNIEASSK